MPLIPISRNHPKAELGITHGMLVALYCRPLVLFSSHTSYLGFFAVHSTTENSRGSGKQAYMLQSITVKLLAGLMSQHSELQNKGKSRELIKTTLSRCKRKMIWNIYWSQKHSVI